RDTGSHTLGGLDGNGELGAETGAVARRHQWQLEQLAALAGHRHADQAAGEAGHEVDVLGGDAFGGDDDIAFVLAVLVIHEDDHLAGADVFDQFFGGIERHRGVSSILQVAVFGKKAFGQARGLGFGGLVAEQQTLQVTRQQIDFEVDLTSGLVIDHDGLGQGVRHDGQFELGAIDRVDGQAGAVDGDRALVRDVLGQLTRRAHLELYGAGVIGARDDLADAIDMAADQVPTEAAGGRQGLFQIHRAARFEVDEGGACQRLAADVGPEAGAGKLHGGQAHAVDGDAVTELDVTQVEFAGGHVDTYVAALRRHGANTADGFDYAGE